jgi:hypothetical protein
MNQPVPLIKCLIAALLAAFTHAAGATEDPYLIQPGQCIGKVCIDESQANVRKALGKPQITHTASRNLVTDIWKANGSAGYLFVTYQGAKVVDVQVSSPKFHTKEGISTASGLSTAQKVFPNGALSEYTVFSNGHLRTDWAVKSRGITFSQADQSQVLVRISVHPTGKDKFVGYSDDEWFWSPR